MREIPLTRGKIVLVDDEDYEHLAAQNWYATAPNKNKDGVPLTWYATRSRWVSGENRMTLVRMHRVILNAPKKVYVDHADGNGLNNQRKNLRLCTPSLNRANSRDAPNEAGFRGVLRAHRRWRAQIFANGIRYNLGAFDDKEAAARAYDAAALFHFGEFARLNFPGAAIPGDGHIG